jgi:hypothetical protein
MSIFVQIASYRDPQLIPTIKDLLCKATYPEQLSICICRQYHPDDGFDNLDMFRDDPRFRIIDVVYNQSQGVCWARHCIQGYYANESYTLQIDSHSRFATGWDKAMINMIESLQAKGITKPLLTGYPAAFDPEDEAITSYTSPPLQMILSHFSAEGIPMCDAVPIPGWESLQEPVPARFYSAGFCFTLGAFCREVRHDPEIYFIGEEISIAIRAFTNGYDLFHPHRMLVWHQYNRSSSSKHWNDHKTWVENNNKSLQKVVALLGSAKPEKSDREFGIGTSRTVQDYETYSGIDLVSGSVRQEVVDRVFPSLSAPFIKSVEGRKALLKGYRLEIHTPSVLFQVVTGIEVQIFDSNNRIVFTDTVKRENLFLRIENKITIISIYFFSKQNPVLWTALFKDSALDTVQSLKGLFGANTKKNSLLDCNF